MLWFYARSGQTTRIETRFDDGTKEFVLVRISPDRPTQTERFRSEASFTTRIAELEHELEREQWTQVGDPQILPDGWRGPTTN